LHTVVKENYSELSATAADFVRKQLQRKPDSVFCFPSGDTPTGMFKILVEESRKGLIDFRKSKFVGLDEWVGMDRYDIGSCQHYMYHHFFDAANIKAEQIIFFNAKAKNLKDECLKMDEYIFQQGGVDLLIVGVGLNGHIGLNEPGSSFENYCHVRKLDDSTIQSAQKWFSSNITLEEGITLGIKHMLQAKEVIVMASGERKSDIIKKIVRGPVGESIPGTAMQRHANAYCLLDVAAASTLNVESQT
jgi:glucosamine-6-phosphate isomerase